VEAADRPQRFDFVSNTEPSAGSVNATAMDQGIQAAITRLHNLLASARESPYRCGGGTAWMGGAISRDRQPPDP